MTLQQLRALVRSIAGDDTPPYRAPDTLLDEWTNEAEEEACLRARLLYETDAEDIALVTDQADYPLTSAALGKRFFWVDGFHLTEENRQRELTPRTADEMQEMHPGWKYDGSGIPEHYITDRLPESVTLWPKPSIDLNGDVMRFRGFKLPDSAMSLDTDTPEIATQWHRNLVSWVLHKYFQLADADIFNADASARHLAEFERDFGPRPDAKLQQLLYRKQGIRFKPRFRIGIYGT